MKGYLRGLDVDWDEDAKCWRYADGVPVDGNPRPCPTCGEPPTADGRDACLGTIAGATSACCGHGRHRGYIAWPGISAPPGWAFGAYVGGER